MMQTVLLVPADERESSAYSLLMVLLMQVLLMLMLMLDSLASVLLVQVLKRRMGLCRIVSWRLLLDLSWRLLENVTWRLMWVQMTALYDTIAGVLDHCKQEQVLKAVVPVADVALARVIVMPDGSARVMRILHSWS